MLEKRLRRLIEQRVRLSLGSVRLEAIVLLQDGLCAYDGLPIQITRSNNVHKNREATIDHVYPRSRGGGDNPRNLVAASHEQNIRKGSQLPSGRWRPRILHSSRDYRNARSLVLQLRELTVQSILEQALDDEVERNRILGNYSLDRLAKTDYYELFESPPHLSQCPPPANILRRA